MNSTEAQRFKELELISRRELVDMIRFHERMAYRNGAQMTEALWRAKYDRSLAQGKEWGRDEMRRLFWSGLIGGLVVGAVVGWWV